MKKICEIYLPFEAMNPNNAYKTRVIMKNRKPLPVVYLSKEGKEYKSNISEIAEDIMKGKSLNKGHIKVVSHWYYGTRRRKDVSNSGKLEYDALNGIVYDDDSQIVLEEKHKIYRKGEPGILLQIYEVPEYDGWKL